MERILVIRSIHVRRAPLRSTSPTRKARKRAYLTDFMRESPKAGLGGGEGGIRTLGTGYPVRQISNLVPSTTRPPLRVTKPMIYALSAVGATSRGGGPRRCLLTRDRA
jgi:hypothetical protein